MLSDGVAPAPKIFRTTEPVAPTLAQNAVEAAAGEAAGGVVAPTAVADVNASAAHAATRAGKVCTQVLRSIGPTKPSVRVPLGCPADGQRTNVRSVPQDGGRVKRSRDRVGPRSVAGDG